MRRGKTFTGVGIVAVIVCFIFVWLVYYEPSLVFVSRVAKPRILGNDSWGKIREGNYGVVLEAIVENIGSDGWVEVEGYYEDNQGKWTHQKRIYLRKNERKKVQFFFSEPTVLGTIFTLSFKYRVWLEVYPIKTPKWASLSRMSFRGRIAKYFIDRDILPPPRDFGMLKIYGEDTIRVFITSDDPFVMSWIKDIGSSSIRELSELITFNIKYKEDLEVHGKRDYWQLPAETIKLASGDCEDQAFLLASLARIMGYSEEEVFVAAGEGHAWVIVRKGKNWEVLEPTDDGWVSLIKSTTKGALFGGLLGTLITTGNPILAIIGSLLGFMAINEGVDYFTDRTIYNLSRDIELMCNDRLYYGKKEIQKLLQEK